MTNLMDLRLMTAAIQDEFKKNFQSEAFAFYFQAALHENGIPFRGQLMAFRRAGTDSVEGIKLEEALSSNSKSYVSKDMKTYIPKGMLAHPKIILHEVGHAHDNQVIGNQIHFWTEVTQEEGSIFCFDNNHPQGISKHDFFATLEFSMEVYLPESEPHPESHSLLSQCEISAHTMFRDDDHRYKTHEQILTGKHLLLVHASVIQYRANIKNEVNWQYRLGKALIHFDYSIMDSSAIQYIIDPPDEKTLYTAQCIKKFNSMKHHLHHMKLPPAKVKKVVDPQFFQED